MITENQIEALLAEYLCTCGGAREGRAWERALDVAATVCSHRADGEVAPFLLGVARYAIAITSGHGVSRILEVYGALQTQCAAQGGAGEPVDEVRNLLAETICRAGEPAGPEPLATSVRALLRTLPLDQLRELTVSGLAREAGLSRAHLTTKLHEEGGATPHQMILAERLRRTLVMLADPSAGCTVAEAARLVGFSDVHYFRRVFHEIFGVSPSAFR